MKRRAVEVPVRVPFDVLRRFVQELAEDQNLSQAYFKLRGTSSPSRVVESTKERLVVYEPAFDPSLKAHGMLRTGWSVAYRLLAISPAETLLEISIEYSRLTGILGFGLIKVQAENEIIHRITSVLAFEKGYAIGRDLDDTNEAQRLLEGERDQQITFSRQPESDTERRRS